jgi:large subunit ribosomal protein L13
MKEKTYVIDAKGKVLGRLASEIAVLLLGKNQPDFDPSRNRGEVILVKNVDKIKLTGKKLEKKKYYRHSGYLGGLKEIPLEKLFKEKPEEVLKRAVLGMLPKNRLRKKMIKRLKFEK